MKPLDDDDRIILETLREAVHEALERKRRLGQYAVVWQSGHPVFIGPNPPADARRNSAESSRPFEGVREPGSDE